MTTMHRTNLQEDIVKALIESKVPAVQHIEQFEQSV
jgi:hypothetical protein